jgi:hypothetical protein
MDKELTAHATGVSAALRAQEEFTPGPWEISGYSDINGHYLHIGAPSSVTVLASMNDTHPATIANARLIAAAPELYKALAAIMNDPRGRGIDPAHRRTAYAALRKATFPTPEAPESKEGE